MARTLTEFLLARVAEDEREAGDPTWCDCVIEGLPLKHGLQCPIRLLAECDVKRRIMMLVERTGWAPGECDECGSPGSDAILERLALPYADHPDYREEWRP